MSARAIFAGGCFWGMEDLIRRYEGVIDTEVGYIGGALENPKYEDVKTGRTGHAEAIEITYDEAVIGYEDLLKVFFMIHDPTTLDRQGNDIGTQYRSAIFYLDDEQKAMAEDMIARARNSGHWDRPIVTTVEKADKFWPAEDFHQDYLVTRPNGYTCHFIREDWVIE